MASVASVNPYAFLNDDDEGNVVAQVAAPADAKDKKAAVKDKKKKAAAAPKADAAPKAAAAVEKSRPKPAARTNAPASGRTEGREVDSESRDNRAQRRAPRPPRGGGRGGRGGARGREFDRHSATGKTDSDKKINQGWGHAGAEYDGEKPAATGEESIEEVSEEDQEAAIKTLDQFMTERNEKLRQAGIEAREARKVVTDDKWKNTQVLSKSEGENFFVGKTATAAPKHKQNKKKKVLVNIEQRFEEETRTTSFRGGRGGFRGGRGGSGPRPRGGRSGTTGMNVDDQSAFPALG